MIWLTKIRTGEAFGVNPTEIKTVQHLDMYMSPREDAPNLVGDPRSPEGEGPWYGNGSHVDLKGKGAEGWGVEQTPDQIRQLLEDHEERFVEAMEAHRLASE